MKKFKNNNDNIVYFLLIFTGVASARRGIVGQHGRPRKPYP